MTATRKHADNNPLDFDLDAVQAEVDLTPFRFKWAGKRWEFKHLQELDSWDVLAASDAGNIKASVALLELALGKAKWVEFRRIPLPQHKMAALAEAYQRHCGIEPGESQGSTGS